MPVKMATFTTYFLLLLVLVCCAPIQAQQTFRLANVFSDEMVLQAAPKSAQIWGFGDAGASVSIQYSDLVETSTVGSDGKWFVRLPPHEASSDIVLMVISQSDADPITINVWFGDVWVCSGQSNMEMPISQTFNTSEEITKALTYKNIRLLRLNNVVSDVEIDEINGITTPWSATSEENVPGFSALCLMFGERLSDSLGGRHIGLIDTTWGGTRIEAWSSPRVTEYCNTPPNIGSGDKQYDHSLWNGMIKPLTNMAVRGAIWYQGEANTGYNIDYYACHIQQLAEDWKNTFVDGTVAVPEENNIAFPFGIAQIGPNSGGGTNKYGYLRWHQSVDIGVQPNGLMPDAFMAATYDTTDYGSPTGEIHPRDKQTVADRLANACKALLYGENLRMNGPIVVSITESTPGVITLTYDMDITVAGTAGFSIRRGDGAWADALIASSSGRDVDVNIESGATHLAYAWTGVVCDYKMCPIYSDDTELLPAQVWLWNLALKRPGY